MSRLKEIQVRHDKCCNYAEYNSALGTSPAHKDRGELLDMVKELEAQVAQTKDLINLYFEGCASDTFDDAVRALKAAIGEDKS